MYTLFIARGYPTEKYKVYGIFEFDQAKALVKEGHKVIYAAIDLRSIRRWRKWGIRKKIIEGVNIYAINIPLGRIPKTLINKAYEIALIIIYNIIVKENGEPDILHAHFTEYGYAATKLKEKTNIPLVVTEHSSLINKKNIRKDIYKMAKVTYSKADSLIAVSHSFKNMIRDNFGVNATYVPNIVDLEIFEYKESTKNIEFTFISIGNLIDLKRMDLTITAFYKAFKRDKNIKLIIFGDGPKRKELESLVLKYKLNSQVKLMGYCSREKIARIMGKSHCFVLASETETFGVSYIEALAMGLPVIATKCGGPEDFVNSKNGILIEINNEKQLIDAMEFMYNNNKSYNSTNISKEIKKRFAPPTVAKKLIKVYEKTKGNWCKL